MKKILSILTIVTSIVAGTAVGTTLQTSSAQAAIAPSGQDLNYARTTILNQTNAARAQAGLAPLVLNASLNNVAQNCSLQQANNMQMAHCTGYQNNYPAGWTRAAENVGYGYSIENVTPAWIASPGHYTNIMDYTTTDIGIGLYYDDNNVPYYTQNFATYNNTTTIPGNPTTVSASPAGSGKASVTWNQPTSDGKSPVTSFEIRATSPNASTVTRTVTSAGQSTQTATLAGLNGGTTYQVTVRAINARGAGAWSPAAQVNITGVPTVTITAINQEVGQAQIVFNATENGSAIESYTLTFSNRPSVTIPGGSEYYMLWDVTPGTNIAGTVTARNADGNSDPAAFSFTALATVPEAPASTTALVENKTEVNVTWEEPAFDGGAPITSYDVTLYENGQVSSTVNVSADVYAHTFSGLTRGNVYQYEVTANNRVGSTPSTQGNILVPVTAPTSTENVLAELVDEQEIYVTWDAPEDNGGVEIQEYEITIYKNGTQETVQYSTTNSVTFNSNIIDPASNYSFSVVAVNNEDLKSQATFSNTVEVPATPTAPTAPTNVTTDVTSNGLTLDWDAPESNGGKQITGYDWELTGNGNTFTGILPADTTEVTIPSLAPYTEYSYRITAVNSVGESPAYTGTVRTLANLPSAPVVTSSQPSGPDTLTVTVNSLNKGGDTNVTYDISLWLEGEELETKTSTTGTVEFGNITPNTTYVVTATATNSAGTSNVGNGIVTSARVSSPVQNLTATVTTNNVVVDWETPEDNGTYTIVGYEVNVWEVDSEAANPTTSEVVNAATTAVTYPVNSSSALQPNVEYRVTVTPLTHTSQIPGVTNEFTFITPIVNPNSVSNSVVEVNPETRNISVTWDVPTFTGGTNVRYYVRLSNQDTSEVLEARSTAGSTATFEYKARPGTRYLVEVITMNSVGNSPAATTYFSDVRLTPLAPEATLTWEEDNILRGTITANADTGGSDLTGFTYHVYNVTDEVWATDVVTTYDPEFTFEGEYGKEYYAVVSSLNVSGSSASATTETTTVPVIAPDNVTNVTVTTTPDTAHVTWDAPEFTGGADIQDYVIQVRQGNTIIDTISVPASETEATIDGLENYEDYSVIVYAVNTSDLASQGTTETFQTTLPAANPVTNVVAENGFGNTNAVTVTWDAPVDVPEKAENMLMYDVVVKNLTTDATTTLNGLRVNNYTLLDLNRGQEYTFDVTAHYGTENTRSTVATSNAVTVTVIEPSIVSNVNVTFNGLEATLNWYLEDNGGAEAVYDITVFNSNETVVDVTDVTETSYTTEKLQPDTEYAFTITAKNSAGSSDVYNGTFETGRVAPSEVRDVDLVVNHLSASATVQYTAPAETGGGTTTYNFILYNATTDEIVAEQETPEFLNLQRGQSYYVVVTASNSAGTSPAVESGNEYVNPEAPGIVTNIETTNVDNGTTDTNITWDAPEYNGGTDITRYIVNVYFEDEIVETVNVETGTETTITGLAPNREYSVTVTAENGYGTSEAVTSFSTPVIVASAPTNVNLGRIGATLLTVEFNESNENGGETPVYEIAIFNADTDELVETTLVNNGNNVIVTLGERGVSYYATVVASNTAGDSEKATSNTVEIPAITPTSPEHLTSDVAEDNTVTVSWDAPTNNGGAPIINYTWTVTEDGEEVSSGTSTTTSTVLTGLKPNTAYGFSVTANNRVGASQTQTTTPLFTTNAVKAEIELETSEVTSESFNYTVNLVNTGGVDENTITYAVTVTDGETVTSFTNQTGTFTDLNYATEYTITATATNIAGTSTVTKTVTTAPVVAEAPTNVKVEIAGQQAMKVTWDAPVNNGGAEVAGYILEWRNIASTVTGSVNTTSTSVIVEGLPLNDEYIFTVKAVNAAGESVTSDESNVGETAPNTKPNILSGEEMDKIVDGNLLPVFKVTIENGKAIVVLGENAKGNWFYGVAYSDPTEIGWSNVVNGTVTYTLPALEAGDHNLAVYDSEGALIGYAPFTLEAAVTPETPTDTTPDTDTETVNVEENTTTKNDELSETGSDFNWVLWGSLGMFFVSAGALLLVSRRKETTTL